MGTPTHSLCVLEFLLPQKSAAAALSKPICIVAAGFPRAKAGAAAAALYRRCGVGPASVRCSRASLPRSPMAATALAYGRPPALAHGRRSSSRGQGTRRSALLLPCHGRTPWREEDGREARRPLHQPRPAAAAPSSPAPRRRAAAAPRSPARGDALTAVGAGEEPGAVSRARRRAVMPAQQGKGGPVLGRAELGRGASRAPPWLPAWEGREKRGG